MKQIIMNYLVVVAIPALIGIVLRSAFHRSPKGCWITAVFGILTAVGWVAANMIPSRGNEKYYIWALMVTCAFVGSGVIGLVYQLRTNR